MNTTMGTGTTMGAISRLSVLFTHFDSRFPGWSDSAHWHVVLVSPNWPGPPLHDDPGQHSSNSEQKNPGFVQPGKLAGSGRGLPLGLTAKGATWLLMNTADFGTLRFGTIWGAGVVGQSVFFLTSPGMSWKKQVASDPSWVTSTTNPSQLESRPGSPHAEQQSVGRPVSSKARDLI